MAVAPSADDEVLTPVIVNDTPDVSKTLPLDACVPPETVPVSWSTLTPENPACVPLAVGSDECCTEMTPDTFRMATTEVPLAFDADTTPDTDLRDMVDSSDVAATCTIPLTPLRLASDTPLMYASETAVATDFLAATVACCE